MTIENVQISYIFFYANGMARTTTSIISKEISTRSVTTFYSHGSSEKKTIAVLVASVKQIDSLLGSYKWSMYSSRLLLGDAMDVATSETNLPCTFNHYNLRKYKFSGCSTIHYGTDKKIKMEEKCFNWPWRTERSEYILIHEANGDLIANHIDTKHNN